MAPGSLEKALEKASTACDAFTTACDAFKIENIAARHRAVKLAFVVVKDLESYSQIIDPSKADAIPCFEKDEIILGDLLGKGGFNQVYEVDCVNLLPQRCGQYNHKTSSKLQQERRQRLADNTSNPRTPDQYAIKFLKREAMEDSEDYCNAAADLMIETKILSNIKPHQNIITLHGVAAAGISGFGEGTEGAYFLILDRLTDTLHDRLDTTWKENKPTMFDRIRVGYDIASALSHLHSQNIIFRDLKPDNVGFDKQGTLKLFDFGLAKELDPRQKYRGEIEDAYEMSGGTGSRRYMAPEVVLEKPYGLDADVYSFGVLFWEICAMEGAFKGMTLKQHNDLVVNDSERPQFKDKWPERLKNIMKWSWMPNQEIRPPISEIRKALKSELRSQIMNSSTKWSNEEMLLLQGSTSSMNKPSVVKKHEKVTSYKQQGIQEPPMFSILSALEASCLQYRKKSSLEHIIQSLSQEDPANEYEIDLHKIMSEALDVTLLFDV